MNSRLLARAPWILLVTAALSCGRADEVETGSAAGRAAGGGRSASAADADAAIRRAMADSTAWPSYGRDYTNRRFSPLAQITPATAARLRAV
jgi:glucose dehydrogenase